MEVNTLIENRELAYVMATAEDPYRCLAKAAIASGLENESQIASRNADRAGLYAGKKYLLELTDMIDLQESYMRKEDKIVRATRDDFFYHTFKLNGQRHKGVATRAWNALARGQNVFEKHGMDDVLVEGDKEHRFPRPSVIAININEDVLSVLPELRECGKMAQTFIGDFYSTKMAELVSTSAE